jgi:hypothetical protein
MSEAPDDKSPGTGSRPGRRRVKDPKDKPITLRCTAQDHAVIQDAANQAGLTIGGYLRKLALGTAGPRAVHPPTPERELLSLILAALGKIGSNVNQLAHGYNQLGLVPGYPEIFRIRQDLAEMRTALMKALGYDHQG